MLTETQWQQYEHKTARTGFFVQKRGEQSFWIVDQHGRHYGEKLLIHLVTKTRVVFKLRYLGEDKGTFFKPLDVFVAEVRSAQPRLERVEVTA